jgi:hypothetical protein
MARQQRFELTDVRQSQDLGFAECALELVRGEDASEIKKGHGRRGDRDAAFYREFAGLQIRTTGDERAPIRACTRDCDFDGAGMVWTQTPEGRRRAMAQYGSRSACQDRRHPASLAGDGTVADRIDAALNAMKTPQAQPVLDGARTQAELYELQPRNHPVLTRGKGGNRPIPAANLDFSLYVNGNSTFVSHEATLRPRR